MRLDDQELERLFIEVESFRVEYKETSRGDNRNAIREAVCAFANDLSGSGQPGIVFVGVTDNGQPTVSISPMKSSGSLLTSRPTD